MTALLNIVLAMLGLTATLAGFGGETWRKGDQALKQRITSRGWVALSCLLLAFAVGVTKEVRLKNAAEAAAEEKAEADRAVKQLLTEIQAQLDRTKRATATANASGIPVPPTNATGTSPADVVQEALNFAVSVAISGEEQFTKGNYREALVRFKQADDFAAVAAIKARIADSYVRLGDYDMAVKYERAAIELAPDWNGPHYVLAFALDRLGRHDEALAAAQKSCDLGFEGGCALAAKLRTNSTN